MLSYIYKVGITICNSHRQDKMLLKCEHTHRRWKTASKCWSECIRHLEVNWASHPVPLCPHIQPHFHVSSYNKRILAARNDCGPIIHGKLLTTDKIILRFSLFTWRMLLRVTIVLPCSTTISDTIPHSSELSFRCFKEKNLLSALSTGIANLPWIPLNY